MKHMLRALIVASLVLAGNAIAAEPPREVFSSATGFVIGPIAFDASLADIRAAVPEAAWKDASISP